MFDGLRFDLFSVDGTTICTGFRLIGFAVSFVSAGAIEDFTFVRSRVFLFSINLLYAVDHPGWTFAGVFVTGKCMAGMWFGVGVGHTKMIRMGLI